MTDASRNDNVRPFRGKRLAAAVDLARRGLKLLPLVPNTKRPAIKRFTENATTDEEQLRAWFDVPSPPNIGYITDDLMVIDIDPRNGGDKTWAALADVDHDPQTFAVKSAQGGTHYIFKLPEGMKVKGRAHALGRGVDVKGRGGLAVGPGSVWCGLGYEILHDRPIIEAPPDLIERAQIASPRGTDAGKRLVEEDDEAIEAATRWMLAEAPEVFDGDRNNTAYWVAATLFDYGVGPGTALDLMLEWNRVRCFPPLPVEGLDSIAVATNSAMTNRSLPIGVKHPRIELAGFVKRDKVQGEPPGATGSEDDDAGDTRQSGDQSERPKEQDNDAVESIDEAADKALTHSAEPLVDGWIDCGSFVVTYGPPKQGKSFYKMHLFFHVAAGRAWCGRRVKKGAVLYLALEGGGGILKRLAAIRKMFPNDKDVPFYVKRAPIDLLRGGQASIQRVIRWIRSVERRAGIKCIALVVDTLARALSGGDENSSADMGALVGNLDIIRGKTGVAIDLVHHTGKDKSRGARGHSNLLGALDTEILVDNSRVTATNQRDLDSEGWSVPFRLKPVSVGHAADGRVVASCIFEPLAKDDPAAAKLSDTAQHYIDQLRSTLADNLTTAFGWEFVQRQVVARTGKPPARQTIRVYLNELARTGVIRKLGENQYQIVSS